MENAQDLHRDLAKSTEASQSRVRLWAEDRFRKERAAVEESLERAEAQGETVRTLLDEAVNAVSKELEILRSESRARDAALEEILDERASDLETRLTEIDNGAAKKRRMSELTKETGDRIGEVQLRVQQVCFVSFRCALLVKKSTEPINRLSCPVCIRLKSSVGGTAADKYLQPIAAAAQRDDTPR